jgi:hypothetical protein
MPNGCCFTSIYNSILSIKKASHLGGFTTKKVIEPENSSFSAVFPSEKILQNQ